MPVLTLKVSVDTAASLQRLAASRRTSKSELIRGALAEVLRRSPVEISLHDVMQATLGALDSGARDLGHNPKYLEGFGSR